MALKINWNFIHLLKVIFKILGIGTNVGMNTKETKTAPGKTIDVSKDEKVPGKRSLYKFKPRRRVPSPPKRPIRPSKTDI